MNDDDTNEKIENTESLPSTGLSPLTRIGPVALECAEQIESAFGEDAQVLAVVVVAEVLARNKAGDYINSIEYASSEHRRWIQLALLEQAVAKAEALDVARVDEVDDALAEDD